MAQSVLLISHPHRQGVSAAADTVAAECQKNGVKLIERINDAQPDMVLVLGGDGTILSGAEAARKFAVPLLGINYGHVGFLAESSADSIGEVIRRIAQDDYEVDSRMTLDTQIAFPDGTTHHDWALNEVAILHNDMAHPAQLVFAVDGQDVSTYGADGIIMATPTGSTAYSFSAGGPVVWPDTQAIVMAPLAAHGLFTRPLVVSPESVLEVGILQDNWSPITVWCDGLRHVDVPTGGTITVTKGAHPVQLARLEDTPFSSRLVNKFNLPIFGWRKTPSRK